MKYTTDTEILGAILAKLVPGNSIITNSTISKNRYLIIAGYTQSIFKINDFCKANNLSLDEVMMLYEVATQKISLSSDITIIDRDDLYRDDEYFLNTLSIEEVYTLVTDTLK